MKHPFRFLVMPRSAYLLSLAIASVLTACASGHHEPVITFCETSKQQEPCTGNQTEFLVGQELIARLDADQPFKAQQIIGKIMRITETDTIPLGSRVISLTADQRSITQKLPFHEYGPQAKGTFLVEFVNENNQAIAGKTLTINDN